MAERKGLRRIVWALDAFEGESVTRSSLIHLLKQISKKTGARVAPVYVLGPAEFNLPINFTDPWLKEYGPLAEKALKVVLAGAEFSELSKPVVLFGRTASHRHSVRALLQYAVKTKADLIAVGTHARKGLSRLFLGSFTETLLLDAKIPLLTVGPEVELNPIDSILFSTDFSPGSDKVFALVLRLAKQLGARLVLFHAVRQPIDPVLQGGVYMGGPGWMPVGDFLQREEKEKRDRAAQWVDRAKTEDVDAEAVFSSEVSSVASEILEMARNKKMGMIALAAQSGRLTSAFLGSIARQVVREAHCPVWVVRNSK
ncbi:universal stress protein [Bdellovibrionota bacterium FG-1]